jgi:hypothetical protein
MRIPVWVAALIVLPFLAAVGLLASTGRRSCSSSPPGDTRAGCAVPGPGIPGTAKTQERTTRRAARDD